MQLQAHTAQTQQQMQMQAQQQTLTLAQQQLQAQAQAQAGRADQQLRELQRDNQRLQAELARQQPAQGQEVIVIVVSRDRRECFRRLESDEQRSEVMAEYTEVDSLYVCMYMIDMYCYIVSMHILVVFLHLYVCIYIH